MKKSIQGACCHCGRQAKFIYQPVAGAVEFLCGLHARRLKGSLVLRRWGEAKPC